MRILKSFAFVIVLSVSAVSRADTYINICNRGEVGVLIAQAIEMNGPGERRIGCDSVPQLEMTYLRMLRLRRKEIKKLPENAFEGLTSLEYLDLSYNLITHLPANVFRPLTSLKSLDLRDNDIRRIPGNVFYGLGSLTEIILNSNEISDISSNAFQGLNSLSALHLAGNKIEKLSANTFRGITSIDFLALSHNPLKQILPNTFQGLKLGALDIAYTQIRQISRSRVRLSPECSIGTDSGVMIDP
jgi:hypothetical protein